MVRLSPLPCRSSDVARGLAIIAVMLAAATASVGAPLAAPPAPQAVAIEVPLQSAVPADLQEGKRVYNAQCALCHGIDGSGGYGPSLLRPMFTRAADDAGLITILRVGIPGLMPGFGDANGPKKTWQLAAFVRSINRSSGERATGNAANGKSLYAAKGCASCHVLNGSGRALGPDLSSIGDQRGLTYLKQALVEPGARVPEGHVVVTARPKSGAPVRGVRISEDAFWVHIRDAGGRLHRFQIADLSDLQREAGASLMPSYSSLSASDLDDMVAYLASLRGQR